GTPCSPPASAAANAPSCSSPSRPVRAPPPGRTARPTRSAGGSAGPSAAATPAWSTTSGPPGAATSSPDSTASPTAASAGSAPTQSSRASTRTPTRPASAACCSPPTPNAAPGSSSASDPADCSGCGTASGRTSNPGWPTSAAHRSSASARRPPRPPGATASPWTSAYRRRPAPTGRALRALDRGAPPPEPPRAARLTMDLGLPAPPSAYEPSPTLTDLPEPPREPFRFRTSIARPGDALLMCSAGLADPLRGEEDLRAHLAGRWSRPEPPGLAAFLADTQVRVKGYADDRTAVAVWEA